MQDQGEAGRENPTELQRLDAVGEKTRQLVKRVPTLQARMRTAVEDFTALLATHQDATEQCHRAVWTAALRVAELGVIEEPRTDNLPDDLVRFVELYAFEYPQAIIDKIRKQNLPLSDSAKRTLQRLQAQYVAQCLRQLLNLKLDSKGPKPLKATNEWRPMVKLLNRPEFEPPPTPLSLSLHDLGVIRAANPDDMITIACMRLGALANLGQIRATLPKPGEDQSVLAKLLYVATLPTNGRARPGDAVADPNELSPDLAEQLLDELEAFTATHEMPRKAKRLPELLAHDRQAWQLATLHGMTQGKVAAFLNKEHGTRYTQGQVSRMIARAQAHAEANGLANKIEQPRARPRMITMDPRRLGLGPRTDTRKPRPSDLDGTDEDN